MRCGLEVKRDGPSADASCRAVRSARVMRWTGRSEVSDASQAIHPVVAWLPSRGAGRRIGAPGGAVRRGGGGNCQSAASAGRAAAREDGENRKRPRLTTTHAMCVRENGRPKCARDGVATGARGSRQVGPQLGSAPTMWRRCYKRASTLVQGASQGPRGGGTMTLLSGFSRCSRPETWEEVPASGATRGVEPCSPDGGSSGTSAEPAARGGRRRRATAPPQAGSVNGRSRTVTRGKPGTPRRETLRLRIVVAR